MTDAAATITPIIPKIQPEKSFWATVRDSTAVSRALASLIMSLTSLILESRFFDKVSMASTMLSICLVNPSSILEVASFAAANAASTASLVSPAR